MYVIYVCRPRSGWGSCLQSFQQRLQALSLITFRGIGMPLGFSHPMEFHAAMLSISFASQGVKRSVFQVLQNLPWGQCWAKTLPLCAVDVVELLMVAEPLVRAATIWDVLGMTQLDMTAIGYHRMYSLANYGKSQTLMTKNHCKLAIFSSYVELPVGICCKNRMKLSSTQRESERERQRQRQRQRERDRDRELESDRYPAAAQISQATPQIASLAPGKSNSRTSESLATLASTCGVHGSHTTRPRRSVNVWNILKHVETTWNHQVFS